MEDSTERPDSGHFQRTDPSELRRAGGGDLEALGSLAAKYRTPLNIYLTLAFPSLKPYTEEILQDFAEDRLLKEGWLARVDLSRGRFRDFLKTSLRNYVLNWLRQRRQEERFLSLDAQAGEGLKQLELTSQQDAAVDAFDLEWLRTIVSETLRRMEEDCRQPGNQQPRRAQTWEIFCLRILEPAFQDTKPPAYDEVARRFSLRSPTEGTNLLLSAKRIFERHLNEVVAEYESRGGEIRAEIEDLKLTVLRLAGQRRR